MKTNIQLEVVYNWQKELLSKGDDLEDATLRKLIFFLDGDGISYNNLKLRIKIWLMTRCLNILEEDHNQQFFDVIPGVFKKEITINEEYLDTELKKALKTYGIPVDGNEIIVKQLTVNNVLEFMHL